MKNHTIKTSSFRRELLKKRCANASFDGLVLVKEMLFLSAMDNGIV
jgi:hypothetical protein